MTDLLTSAQMRAAEHAEIASGRVTGAALMERAGAGVVRALRAGFPHLRRARVICGPGNNGGDGFVIARLLRQAGWQVEALLFGDPPRMPPDAARARALWEAMAAGLDGAPEVLIDAGFGTGLTRPVPEALADALAAPALLRVAVDAPSGLSLDSGRMLGRGAPPQDLTVTFQQSRPGHWLAEGPHHCGRLMVCDIGLPATESGVRLAEARAAMLDKGAVPGAHKFGHGHALVLAGGVGRGGAARLTARGALRIGAGLVTLACPPAALQENAARLDAVMLRSLRDAEGLRAMLADDRIAALCLGPGLGVDRAAEMLPVALAAGRPVVLDADALTAFAQGPAALAPDCVLTPHGGEFARLFPDLAKRLGEEPLFSRLDAARQAAARVGAVVLLKGPDTVIAAPDGRVAISAACYDRAAPWLATAGAGDVLAGFIAGLLARGHPAFEAAQAAVVLHVDCARAFGPGLIAEDLPDMLPRVLRGLL